MKPVQIKICIIIALLMLSLASSIATSKASNQQSDQYNKFYLAHIISVFIQFAGIDDEFSINPTNITESSFNEQVNGIKKNKEKITIEFSNSYTHISGSENTSIRTDRLNEKPVELKEPHFKSLLYLDIHPESPLDSGAVIRIFNEWQRSDLVIYHYKDNEWQQLETIINGDYLEAVTGSFSIFAVGAPGGINLRLQADTLILINDTITVAGAAYYNNSTAASSINVEINPSWSLPFSIAADQQGNFLQTITSPQLPGNYTLYVNASSGILSGSNNTTIQVTNATIYRTNATARITNNPIADPFANISFPFPESAVPELSRISLNLNSSTFIEVKINNITLYNSTTSGIVLNLTGYLVSQNDINITASNPVNLTYTIDLGFHKTSTAQVAKTTYYSAALNITNTMTYDWNNSSILYHIPAGSYDISVWENSTNITGSSVISGNILRIKNSGIGTIYNNSIRNFKANYNLKHLDINITLDREEIENGETVLITPGVYFNSSMADTNARMVIYRDSAAVYDTNVSSGTAFAYSNTIAGVYNITAYASMNIDGVERTGSNRTFIHIKDLLIYANADPALSGRQIKINGRAYYTNNTGYEGTINISSGSESYIISSNASGYFSYSIPGKNAGTYTISATASTGNYIASANAISQVHEKTFFLVKGELPVISSDVTLAPDALLWVNQTNITSASIYLYCKTAIHLLYDPMPITHKLITTPLNSYISGTFNLPLYPYDYLEILSAFLNTTAEDPIIQNQDFAFNVTIDDREVDSVIIPHGDAYFTISNNIKGFIPDYLKPGNTQTVKIYNKNTGSSQQYYFTSELYVDYIGHISTPCDLFLKTNNNFTYANVGSFTNATIDITGFKAASNNIRLNNCRRTSIIGYNITLQKQYFGYTTHSAIEGTSRYNVTDTALFNPGSNLTSVTVIIPLVGNAKDVSIFVNGTNLTAEANISENIELFLPEVNSTKIINITYWTPILDFVPSVDKPQFNRGDTAQIKADITYLGQNVTDAVAYANISKAGAAIANVTLNFSYGGTYLADHVISQVAAPGIYNITVWAYNATTVIDSENTTFRVRGLNVTANSSGPYLVDTNASITGYVKDLENNSGINGASVNITIWNSTFSFSTIKTTNSTGYYSLSRTVDYAGDYNVTINASDANIRGTQGSAYKVKYKVNIPLLPSYEKNSTIAVSIMVYDRSLIPVEGATVRTTINKSGSYYYYNGVTDLNGTFNFTFNNTGQTGYYYIDANVSKSGVIGNATGSLRVSSLSITGYTDKLEYNAGENVTVSGSVKDIEVNDLIKNGTYNISIYSTGGIAASKNGSITFCPGCVFYDEDTFETSVEWSNRNSYTPVRDQSTAFSGFYSLRMTWPGTTGWGGRNFEGTAGLESGQTSGGYSTTTYPYMSMAYRISPDDKINMLILVNGLWRSIALTQGSSPSGNYPTVAAFQDLISDDQWHWTQINLDEQLDASLGTGNHQITAVIWHDHDYLPVRPTGDFWIDDFRISNKAVSLNSYNVTFTGLPAGSYSANVNVSYSSIIGSNTTVFDVHYNLNTSINKTIYAIGEPVPINVTVFDTNGTLANANISINITKPDASVENINSAFEYSYFNATFTNASIEGDYIIRVHARNGSTTAHGDAVNRSFRASGFAVNASTDRTPSLYRPGETVNISGLLRDTLGSSRTADVIIRIDNYTGEVINSTLTGRNGSYAWNYTLASDSQAGWYTVTVNATTPEGIESSATTQFEVQLNVALSAGIHYNPGDAVNATIIIRNGSAPQDAVVNIAVQKFDIWNEFTGTYFDTNKMFTVAPDCCIDGLNLIQNDELLFYTTNLTPNNTWIGKAVQLNTSSLPSHFILDYEVSTGGTSSQLLLRPTLGNATSYVRLNYRNYSDDLQDGYGININGIVEKSIIENTNNKKVRLSIEYDTGIVRFYKNGEQFYQGKFTLPADSTIKLNGYALNPVNGSSAYLKYDNITLYKFSSPILSQGIADGSAGNYTYNFTAGNIGMYRINASTGNSSNYTMFKVRTLNVSSVVYGPYNFNESTLSNNTVIPLLISGVVQDTETHAGITGAVVNITILQDELPQAYRISSSNLGNYVLSFAGDLNNTAIGLFNISVKANDRGINADNNNSFRAYNVTQTWADPYMDYRVPILINNDSGLVARWQFNEGIGTIVTDSSGNGNTGTLYVASVSNPGFETANSQWGNGAESLVFDNTRSKTGTYSGKIVKLDAGEKVQHSITNSNNNAGITLPSPISQYRYGGCIYIEGGASADIFFFSWNSTSGNRYDDTYDAISTSVQNQWVCINGTTTNVSSSDNLFDIRVDNNGGGTVWFDEIYANPVEPWTTGKYGTALQFDGRNDYIQINPSPSLNFSYATYSMWLKVGPWVQQWNSKNITVPLFQGVWSNGPAFWILDDPEPSFRGVMYVNKTLYDVNSTPIPIDRDSYHMLTMSFNGTSFRVYLDGVLKYENTSITGVLDPSIFSNPLIIGAANNGGWRDFSGSIDEVSIYNRALSDWEIADSYNSTNIAHNFNPAKVSFNLALPGGGLANSAAIYDIDKNLQPATILDLGSYLNVSFTRPLSAYEGKILYLYFERPAPVIPDSAVMSSLSAPSSVEKGTIEGYRLTITPDKNVYSAGENVVLASRLANVTGSGLVADITTTIYYPNGTIAQVNYTQTDLNGEASINYTIPAIKGIFIAETQTSVFGIIRKENTSFNVGDLVVYISTDRAVYNTLENTNIKLKVTQNDSITAADVTLKIYDPDNVKVFEETINTKSYWTQTSNADFNAGTLSDVNVSDGSVTLSKKPDGYYYTSGSLVSRVYDGENSTEWGNIFWSANSHSSNNITFYTRTSQNNISWSDWVQGEYYGDIQESSRYIQYRADFATSNNSKTPTLEDITIETAVPVDSSFTLPASPLGNYTLAVSATQSGNAGFNSTIIELDRFDITAATDKPVYTTNGNITASGITKYRGVGANADVNITVKKNLAITPSFETDLDTNAQPDGWLFAWNGTGTWDTVPRSGSYSVKVTRSIIDTTEGLWYYPNMYVISPNVNYSFSAWVKTDNIAGGNARLWVTWYNGTTGLSTAINSQNAINAQDGWVQIQGTAKSPANANNARVHLVSNIVGSAWFDDVNIEPENNPSVYSSDAISSPSYGFTFPLASAGSYVVYSNGSYAANGTLNRSTTTVFAVRSLDVNTSAGGPFEPGMGSVTIKGYAVDNRTRIAIPNAAVQINVTYPNGTLRTYTNTTNSQGFYTSTISTPRLGGTYSVNVSANDYQNIKGFTNTSFRINLTLSVAANKAQYNLNETALISVNVSDSTSGISGGTVNISVKNPLNQRTNFSTLYGNVTYQGNGIYTTNYTGTALAGNYTINATASNGTDIGSSNSSFMVRKLNVTIQSIFVKVGDSGSILARVEDEITHNTIANATVNITISNTSSVVNMTNTTSTGQSGYNIAAPLYTDRAGRYNITMNVTDLNNIIGQAIMPYTVNMSVEIVLDRSTYEPGENIKGTITIRESNTSMASDASVVTRFEYYNGSVISSNSTTSNSSGIAQVEFTAPPGYSSYIVNVTASKNSIIGTGTHLFAASNLRIWTDQGEAQIGGSAWGQNDAPEEYRNITVKVAALSSAGMRRTGQNLTARIYYPNGSIFGNYTLKESDKIYSGYVLLPGKNIPEGKYDIELAQYPGVRSNFSVIVWGCVNCHKPNTLNGHYYYHDDSSIAPSDFKLNHSHKTVNVSTTYDAGRCGYHSNGGDARCSACHRNEAGSASSPAKCKTCHNSAEHKDEGYLNDSYGADIHANINNKPGGQWYGKTTACESCHGTLNSTQKPSIPLCTDCHPNSSGSDMKVMPGGLHGSNKTLEDFEEISDVTGTSGYRYSTVSLSIDPMNHTGSNSAKVDYGFGSGYGRIYIEKKNLELANATKIILWVYGDNSGINLSLGINNTKSTQINWHQSAPIQINWIGWRKISFNIPELSQSDLMYITYADTIRIKLESTSELGGSGIIYLDDLIKEAVGSHTQFDEIECGVCHGESHNLKRAPQCQYCHQTQEHGWPAKDRYPGDNATCMQCHMTGSTQNMINISNISLHTEFLEDFESPQLFNSSLTYFNRSDVYYSGPFWDEGNHSARLDYTGLNGYLGNSLNLTNASKFKGISVFVNGSNDPGTKLVLGVYTTKWYNYTINLDWNGWKEINVLYHNITVNENVSFNATGTPTRIWMGVYGSNSTGTIYIDDLRQAVSDDYHQYVSWNCTDCHDQIKNLPGITDVTSPITDCSICHNKKEPHYKQFNRVCTDCHFDSRHGEIDDGNLTGYEKASTCLKCHIIPHDFNQTHLETANCNNCHQQRIHGQNYQNVVYNESIHIDCERCHGKTTADAPLPIGLGSPRTTILRLSFTYNNVTQCLYCHKDRIFSYELHINTTVNRSNQSLVERILNDSICSDCHGEKSFLNNSDRDELTAVDPMREPHAPQIEGHGNVSCYKCHGHRPERLTLNYGSNCVGCHQDTAALVELMPGTVNDSSLSNVTNPGEDQLIVHPPQVTGHGNASCSNCHGHVNSKLLYVGSKASDCANCHENISMVSSLLPFRQPDSERSTVTNVGGNPLYVNPPQVLGHGNTSCMECHEHAPSTFKGFDFIEGMVCEDCHQNMSRNVSLIDDTSPKSNRTKIIDNATVISPQVAGHGSTACSECHSHSAERMVYYGGKNKDCVTCHYNSSSEYTLLRNGSSVEPIQITPHQDMNCTECHGHTPSNMTRINDCRICHQNSSKAQSLIDTYGNGLNLTSPGINITAVQIPFLQHSNSGIAGRKWNKTVAYWANVSDSCQYCHRISVNYSDHNPLGRVSMIQGNNIKNSSLTGSFWCASCHYQGYSSGNVTYNDVVNTYIKAGLPVPPEITANSSYGNYTVSNDGGKYYAHGLTDYSDLSCAKCHGHASNSTEFLHTVTIGAGGSACMNCHDNSTGPVEDPERYPGINVSLFNNHKKLNNTNNSNIIDDNDCILCHYNVTDMDQPGWTTPTRTCIDCHINGNFSAIKIDNHRQDGVKISTSVNCTICHINSINKYNYSINASISHYGTNKTLVTSVNRTQKPKFGFMTTQEAAQYNRDCNNCHNPSNPSYGNATPVTMPHAGRGTCNECHVNSTGSGDTLHNISLDMPITTNCQSCHTTNADKYGAPNLTGLNKGGWATCNGGSCHGTDITSNLDTLAKHNVDRTKAGTGGSTTTVYLNAQGSLTVTRGVSVSITSSVNDATGIASKVGGAEYYIDVDPGLGKGIPMNAVDGYYNAVNGAFENVVATLDTGSLSGGTHTIYVRGMDIGKQWSAPKNATLIIQVFGYINGTVTNATANLISGVYVSTTGANDITGSDGNYSLRLVEGTYNVTFSKPPEYYDFVMPGVIVTPGNTTRLDPPTYIKKQTGTISGVVRNP